MKVTARYLSRLLAATSLVVLLFSATACKKHQEGDNDPDLIARVGKQRLTRLDLNKLIANNGLTPEDSTRFTRAYIRNWIDDHLMGEVASRHIPDMSEIDRMVEEYRNQLIGWEYRRLMFLHNGLTQFSEDSVAAFYESHADQYLLERPIIKGIYIKIDDRSPSLATIKKLYRSDREADLDKLDKEDFKGVMHYDYFRDRWVDWEQIETRIPYDFSPTPDVFLATHDHAEVSLNGFTYLLCISDYLRSGSRMPLEIARERIQRDLFNTHRREYDARLLMDLYQQGINDGTIVVNTELD